MNYEYQGTFLTQWPAGRRSLIVNQFCYAVRSGAKDPEAVIQAVAWDAQLRFSQDGDGTPQGEAQRILLAVIDDPETLKFAEFILWRESLPHDEKQRLKAEAGKDFARAYMAEQQPTLKQLAYLKFLGCETTPKSKLEAHDLIDKFKSGNVQRPEQSAHRA